MDYADDLKHLYMNQTSDFHESTLSQQLVVRVPSCNTMSGRNKRLRILKELHQEKSIITLIVSPATKLDKIKWCGGAFKINGK